MTIKNGEVAEEADVVFLSIKPHILAEAVANIYNTMTSACKISNKLFVSILAGVTLSSLENVKKNITVNTNILFSFSFVDFNWF